MPIIEKNEGGMTTVFFTHAEKDAILPKGKVASQLSGEEYWREIDRVFAQQYPGCELCIYFDPGPEDI